MLTNDVQIISAKQLHAQSLCQRYIKVAVILAPNTRFTLQSLCLMTTLYSIFLTDQLFCFGLSPMLLDVKCDLYSEIVGNRSFLYLT